MHTKIRFVYPLTFNLSRFLYSHNFCEQNIADEA